MKCIIKKIMRYIEGRRTWNAKMSEHLKITIITPNKNN